MKPMDGLRRQDAVEALSLVIDHVDNLLAALRKLHGAVNTCELCGGTGKIERGDGDHNPYEWCPDCSPHSGSPYPQRDPRTLRDDIATINGE